MAPRAVLLALMQKRADEEDAADVEALRVVVTGSIRDYGKRRRVASAMEMWVIHRLAPSFRQLRATRLSWRSDCCRDAGAR